MHGLLNPFVSIISLPIMTILISIITKLYQIIAVSSPFILFGFLIAGVLHVMLHESLFRRVFGREGVMPLLRAVGLGSLIPICSCGVVPIGVGAYKSGAGTGTVLAFMTAAPALSPASVLLSIKLLGLELAGWQIGSVVVGSFLLGLIANRLFRSYVLPTQDVQPKETELVSLELSPALEASSATPSDCCSATVPTVASCCSSSEAAQPESETESSCCGSDEKNESTKKSPRGIVGTIKEIFHWIVFDFGPSVSLDMLIGLTFAAAVLTLVPEDVIVLLTGSKTIWSLLLVILVALPVYTCSMAAIPVVFSFLAAGMSPGAAVAFLIGGPATNFGEMNAIRHQMSWKIAVYYFCALLLLAVVSGGLVDHFVELDLLSSDTPSHEHSHAHASFTWLQHTSSFVLFFMMSIDARRRFRKFMKFA